MKFESGISDYIHIPITVDVMFPLTQKNEPVIVCDFCKLYTGRKCILTDEVVYSPTRFVGYNCPLKEIAKDE